MPPESGSRVGSVSRYELHLCLGEGSSGPVYKAWDPELERWVALRLIPPGLAGRGEERQPLIREALAVASLEHPNVGPVYEVGEAADGSLFLVSALSEGETLEERLRRGPMRMEGAVEIAAQIAAAVGRAHEHGLLHGRLRPTNVWVGADGQVRVVDFGLCGLEERTWRTLQIAPQSREYLAPELLLGETVSPRSDVWAIGALLAAMLGRREGLPDDLSRIVERSLSSRPSDRHPSAGALRDDLRGTRESSPRPAGRAPGQPPDLSGVRRLSQYRIGELLGGGGMGVVYKAEDLQLGRTVALKFLPAEMASDPAAKARFLQEARAASALDHPNLCTVYEIGETEEGRLYLAMPCYEGETLRARIARGPLPVHEAMDCALQVARGLARAHRQGIVHRDIKPANLMVTTDGLVKILDFGVAKLAGEASLTRTGAAVGTAAYMAPEQIRGEAVDARADLWSLGVVLYEMVTGRRPFPGDNPEAVRHAVLTREPEPVRRLRPDASPELERVIRGLLAKDAAARYPTADAVAADQGLFLGASSDFRPISLSSSSRMGKGILFAVCILLTAAGAVGLVRWLLERRAEPEGIPSFSRLTEQEGAELYPALSPEGTFFAYTKLDGADLDIFFQRVGGGKPINLTGDSEADDLQPAFSPDGREIAFRSERAGGGIFKMGATGESVRRLSNFGFNPSWSPDGRELVVATESTRDQPWKRELISRLWKIDIGTGTKRRLDTGDAVQPSWSPDGKWIAYWGVIPGSSQRAIWTVSAEGRDPVQITDGQHLDWNPVWSPDSRHLYFVSDRGGSMNSWRIPVNGSTGQAAGPAESMMIPSRSSNSLSFSRDGRLALYATDEDVSELEAAVVDLDRLKVVEPPKSLLSISKNVRSVDVSPDRKWLVFDTSAPQEDLFLVGIDGEGLLQLTDDVHKDRGPRWSPDGETIAFFSNRSGRFELWSIRRDGSGLSPITRTSGPVVINPIWSPQDRRMVCGLGITGRGAILELANPIERRIPSLLPVATKRDCSITPNSWSRDGRLLVGGLEGKGKGIGVYSFSDHSCTKLTDRGWLPFWVPGRKAVLMLERSRVLEVELSGKINELISAPLGSTYLGLSPAQDGKTVYVVRRREEGDIWQMGLR